MEDDALAMVEHAPKDKLIEATNAGQITTIRELRPTSHSKVLETRAYRKCTAITYAKKDQSGFTGRKKETGHCCILIDREVCLTLYGVTKTYQLL